MYRHISRNQSDLVVPCPQISRIHLFAASEIICAFWAGLIPAMLQGNLNFIAVMPVMSQMSRIPQQRAIIFQISLSAWACRSFFACCCRIFRFALYSAHGNGDVNGNLCLHNPNILCFRCLFFVCHTSAYISGHHLVFYFLEFL